ncbi:hypothetical protein EOM86_09765, partial [Candidatus Nomurabacteria bacterium]|nr:hypothetical protein [Candidatus Nomurabacteria bacterium]
MMIYMITLIGYVFFVLYYARKYATQCSIRWQKNLLIRQQNLKKIEQEKESRYQEKMRLEEEAIRVFTLYEITREITKNINEKEAFDIFEKKLEEHVKFKACRFIKADVKDIKQLKSSEDAYIFALHEKKKLLGYLVFDGIQESDKEKIMILGNQFALVLRRVFLYQEIERVAITDSLTEVHTR